MKRRNGETESRQRSVNGFFDDVGGEGLVAADADRVSGESALLLIMAARQDQVAERGKKNLAVVCRDEVVENGVDGRADVEEHIGDHVEVVVEIEENTVGERKNILREMLG